MKDNHLSKVRTADFRWKKNGYPIENTLDFQDNLSMDHDFYCFDNLLYDDGWYYIGAEDTFKKTVISGMCGTYKIEIRSMPEEVFLEKYGDRELKKHEDDLILHQRHVMAGLSHIIFDEMLNLFFQKHYFGQTQNTVIFNNPNPDAIRAFDDRQFPQGWDGWLRDITNMGIIYPNDINGPCLFRRVMTGWITPNRFWRCKDFDMKDFRFFVLNNLGLDNLPPPEGIVFVDRPYRDKHSRRAILNMDEVSSMLEGIPSSGVAAMERLSFREQVEKVASSKVFIAAHGAAMTHVFFMQAGTAGIEIMPYNFEYHLYEDLARSVGVDYNSFCIGKDDARLNIDILKGILAGKGLDGDLDGIIEEILENDIRSGDRALPMGLTRSDLKPLFRDQHLYVDTERLRKTIKKYI